MSGEFEYPDISQPSAAGRREPLAEPLRGEGYARAFKAFRDRSDQREAMLEWLAEHSALLFSARPKECRVLSVGGGNGSFDLAAMPLFLRHVLCCNCTVLEPNDELRSEFEYRVRQGSAECAFSFFPGTLERFAAGHREQYDLIHFTHCLYYMPDQGAAIDAALDLRAPGGRILIFNATPLGFAQMRARFTGSLLGRPSHYFTSLDLMQLLDARGMPYEISIIPVRVQVNACFRADDREGLDLMSFIVGCDLRRTPAAVRASMLQRLSEIAVPDRDGIWLQHPVAAVLI